MGMDLSLTWLSILGGLAMGLGAVFVFIYAVKNDYFQDLENVKYQVFWSDMGETNESSIERGTHHHVARYRRDRQRCRAQGSS